MLCGTDFLAGNKMFRFFKPLLYSAQEETKKDRKEKPRQVKEDRKTGLIDKRMYFKFWNLSFGFITCPLIVLLVAGAQAVKILQEQEALTWFVYSGFIVTSTLSLICLLVTIGR